MKISNKINIINFKNLYFPNNSDMAIRRYDIDWYRIIAYALFILCFLHRKLGRSDNKLTT